MSACICLAALPCPGVMQVSSHFTWMLGLEVPWQFLHVSELSLRSDPLLRIYVSLICDGHVYMCLPCCSAWSQHCKIDQVRWLCLPVSASSLCPDPVHGMAMSTRICLAALPGVPVSALLAFPNLGMAGLSGLWVQNDPVSGCSFPALAAAWDHLFLVPVARLTISLILTGLAWEVGLTGLICLCNLAMLDQMPCLKDWKASLLQTQW